jgi:hypothetical protein
MILGLPIDSFILLLGLPAIIIAVMFYYSSKIKSEKEDE